MANFELATFVDCHDPTLPINVSKDEIMQLSRVPFTCHDVIVVPDSLFTVQEIPDAMKSCDAHEDGSTELPYSCTAAKIIAGICLIIAYHSHRAPVSPLKKFSRQQHLHC